MAFVYKSADRFLTKPPTRSKVGPGTYLGHANYDISRSQIPFNSSSYRKSIKSEEKPGPGSYNVSNEYLKEKLIASNLNMDIKIVEIPKPNGVFKSSSKRFDDEKFRKDYTPAPGDYDVQENIDKIAYKYKNQKNPHKEILVEMQKEMKVKKIPSIPTSQQVLGYCEREGIQCLTLSFIQINLR